MITLEICPYFKKREEKQAIERITSKGLSEL